MESHVQLLTLKPNPDGQLSCEVTNQSPKLDYRSLHYYQHYIGNTSKLQ